MTSLLFIISFLLHIIALFAIYQLFKETQNLKKTHIEDLDELMTAYLDELRVENERLESRLSNKTQLLKSSISSLRSEEPSEDNEIIGEGINEKQLESERRLEFSASEIPMKQEDQFTTSLQSRILLLAQQGKKPAEIAKELDCGETEAALVMKLHKRNDNA